MKLNFHNYEHKSMGRPKGDGSQTHNPESFHTVLDEPMHNFDAIQLTGGTK